LALNFNMPQLTYPLKKHNNYPSMTTIDGFQRLPSPGFYLNARQLQRDQQ
jgi:hypothetical protein